MPDKNALDQRLDQLVRQYAQMQPEDPSRKVIAKEMAELCERLVTLQALRTKKKE
jgi:hypothetical protein